MIVSWSPWPSMPKPTTGLPVVGDAVDDLLGPAVLDADHDHRGDVRVAAGADQRAEVQVEVGAELQPAVGVRDRHRALDVVGDRLGRGVRQVVERQDDDVVAHADAAVLAPVAQEGGLLVDDRLDMSRAPCLPALGLDVVHVGVLAGLDRRDHLAHVDAVLDDGVARLPCPSARPCGRSGCPGAPRARSSVVVHDPAGERRAGLDAFDHDHRDGVARRRAIRNESLRAPCRANVGCRAISRRARRHCQTSHMDDLIDCVSH